MNRVADAPVDALRDWIADELKSGARRAGDKHLPADEPQRR